MPLPLSAPPSTSRDPAASPIDEPGVALTPSRARLRLAPSPSRQRGRARCCLPPLHAPARLLPVPGPSHARRCIPPPSPASDQPRAQAANTVGLGVASHAPRSLPAFCQPRAQAAEVVRLGVVSHAPPPAPPAPPAPAFCQP
ncbi:hypothetical protein PUNSTDRAFT_128951 [Punctularia strigosozonata HHB-11173 SS5]|uniref:uncharacterized protein n=1 Tax=Punctularia strigosozonata (strain HHB-11173) TaxID=741275 RepID=UPI0004416AB4|nr:uncharacterized protein PUNSTDRAFT_128951 [Punctularia strigosozonata HHB-11173 SS5]EIN13265.1 hypothetical protein PUNSTDRAFT_128951 [Punctularia strigosozonata HHB-11173 SS5]